MNELFHVLTDPAHWMAEVVMDFTIAIPFYFLGKWRVRVHDRKIHGTPSPPPPAEEWIGELPRPYRRSN